MAAGAGEPDLDGFTDASPFLGLRMTGEKQVDPQACDVAAPVFDAPIPIAGDEHDRAEREKACIGRQRAAPGAGSGGGIADFLGLSGPRAVFDDRPSQPVPLPSAAGAAGTVACGFERQYLVRLSRRGFRPRRLEVINRTPGDHE